MTSLTLSGPLFPSIQEEQAWRRFRAIGADSGSIGYLRTCFVCLHRGDAQAGLDAVQTRRGLIGRLALRPGKRGLGEQIRAASLSTDGRSILTSGSDGPQIWDAVTGQPRLQLEFADYLPSLDERNRLGSYIETVRFLDDSTIAGASDAGVLWLWNLGGDSVATIPRVDSTTSSPEQLVTSADGNTVAFLHGEGAVLWRRGSTGASHLPHYAAEAIGLDRTGRLVTASSDSIVWWSGEADGDRGIFEIRSAGYPTGMSNRGERLLIPNGDTLEAWNTRTGRRDTALSAGDEVTASCFDDESGLLAAGTRRGALRLWLRGVDRPVDLEGHTGSVSLLECSATGPWLASAGRDGREVKVWNRDRLFDRTPTPAGPPLTESAADLPVRLAALGADWKLPDRWPALFDFVAGHDQQLAFGGFFGLAGMAILFAGWQVFTKPSRRR